MNRGSLVTLLVAAMGSGAAQAADINNVALLGQAEFKLLSEDVAAA